MQLNLPLPPRSAAGDLQALWSCLYQLTERLNTLQLPVAAPAAGETTPAGTAVRSHASSDTGFGAADGSTYGHVRLSDAPDAAVTQDAAVAATPAALAAVQTALEKTDTAHAARLTALEKTDITHDTKLAELADTDDAIVTKLNSLQSTQISQSGQITGLQSTQTGHAIRIGKLEDRTVAVVGTGTISYGSSYQSATISFGTTFQQPPTVLVSQVFDDTNLVVKSTNVTTTKFTVGLAGTFSSSGTRSFGWAAIGTI